MLITMMWVKQELSYSAVLTASGALPTVCNLFNTVAIRKVARLNALMFEGRDDNIMNSKRQRQYGAIHARRDFARNEPLRSQHGR